MVYRLIYGLWWFMVAHGSNLWYIPTWELVPDMTRTNLGTITYKWYIQSIYYLLISVEIYMVAEENNPSTFLKKKKRDIIREKILE